MNTIRIENYAKILSREDLARQIYDAIMQCVPADDGIIIDMKGVITMTTQCAKLIFGKLYVELTPSVYFEKVKFVNKSQELDIIISFGIEHAIRESKR